MLQVIEQTREEKMAMYMAIEKEKLCEMLINCNTLLNGLMKDDNKKPAYIHINDFVVECSQCGKQSLL